MTVNSEVTSSSSSSRYGVQPSCESQPRLAYQIIHHLRVFLKIVLAQIMRQDPFLATLEHGFTYKAVGLFGPAKDAPQRAQISAIAAGRLASGFLFLEQLPSPLGGSSLFLGRVQT